MNAQSIVNMILKQVLGRVVRHGVDAGINAMAKRGDAPDSPEARKRAQSARRTMNQTQRMAKMARRIGRF